MLAGSAASPPPSSSPPAGGRTPMTNVAKRRQTENLPGLPPACQPWSEPWPYGFCARGIPGARGPAPVRGAVGRFRARARTAGGRGACDLRVCQGRCTASRGRCTSVPIVLEPCAQGCGQAHSPSMERGASAQGRVARRRDRAALDRRWRVSGRAAALKRRVRVLASLNKVPILMPPPSLKDFQDERAARGS